MYYTEFVVSVDLLKMILLFNCTRASYQNTEKNSSSLKYLTFFFFKWNCNGNRNSNHKQQSKCLNTGREEYMDIL